MSGCSYFFKSVNFLDVKFINQKIIIFISYDRDAGNYPFKFFLVQSLNRPYIAQDQVLVTYAETHALEL